MIGDRLILWRIRPACLASLTGAIAVGEVGAAMRWYLGDRGVIRLDLVAMSSNREGQLVRAAPGNTAPWFETVGEHSARYGTYVRAGQTIATVDVSGHWAPKSGEEPKRLAIPPAVVATSEPYVLPKRCKGRTDWWGTHHIFVWCPTGGLGDHGEPE